MRILSFQKYLLWSSFIAAIKRTNDKLFHFVYWISTTEKKWPNLTSKVLYSYSRTHEYKFHILDKYYSYEMIFGTICNNYDIGNWQSTYIAFYYIVHHKTLNLIDAEEKKFTRKYVKQKTLEYYQFCKFSTFTLLMPCRL